MLLSKCLASDTRSARSLLLASWCERPHQTPISPTLPLQRAPTETPHARVRRRRRRRAARRHVHVPRVADQGALRRRRP